MKELRSAVSAELAGTGGDIEKLLSAFASKEVKSSPDFPDDAEENFSTVSDAIVVIESRQG